MLVKLGRAWVDPTTIRAISRHNWNGDEGTKIRWKSQGGELPGTMEIVGIKVDEAAEIINKALENPLFYED